MDTGLNGKAALVGGASKGIGRAVATALAREGCDVAICAREERALARATAEIRVETGVRVFSQVCDMSREEEIKRFVAAGGGGVGRVGIVVNKTPRPPTRG